MENVYILIRDTTLSNRAKNSLVGCGIITINDLLKFDRGSKYGITNIRGVGKTISDELSTFINTLSDLNIVDVQGADGWIRDNMFQRDAPFHSTFKRLESGEFIPWSTRVGLVAEIAAAYANIVLNGK
jgi:hypothetical protein